MLSCKQATQLASDSRERPLRVSEKIGLKIHLAMCKGCRNFDKNVGNISTLMKQFSSRKDK